MNPLFPKQKHSAEILDGSAMVQVASCLFLTMEARIHSHAHPYVICGRDSGTGTHVSPSTHFSLVNYDSSHLSNIRDWCDRHICSCSMNGLNYNIELNSR
jgi:hypothetical protein